MSVWLEADMDPINIPAIVYEAYSEVEGETVTHLLTRCPIEASEVARTKGGRFTGWLFDGRKGGKRQVEASEAFAIERKRGRCESSHCSPETGHRNAGR